MRYGQLRALIDKAKPRTIIEVGTHRGTRAWLMCMHAFRYWPDIHYTGYDLFEDATNETDTEEMNGKSRGSLAVTREQLEAIKRLYPQFRYRLVKGNTRDTLHGRNITADFVFIDGGHSVQTIRGDYEALKGSNVVVFDDYYPAGIDVSKYGCNTLLADIPHRLLPETDLVKGGGSVQMAVRL